MITQKNTITIEVLQPMFSDTKKPFLVGDWITAVRASKIEADAIYYISPIGEKQGVFRKLRSELDVFEGNEVYKVEGISRFL